MTTLQRAEELFQKGELPQAMQTYQLLMQKQPQNPDVYFAFGQFLTRIDQLETAERLLQFGLKLDPENVDGMHVLAQLYRKMDRLEDAATLFKKAEIIGGQTSVHFLSSALFFEQAKNIDEANASFIKSLKKDPKNLNAVFYYARFLYRAKNDLKAAIALIEPHIGSDADYPELEDLLASFYFRERNMGDLKALAQREDLAPHNHVVAQTWWLLWQLQRDNDGVPETDILEFKPEYRNQDSFERLLPLTVFRMMMRSIRKEDHDEQIQRGFTGDPLYLFGDSHCLPAAGLLVKNGAAHVESRLIPGIKLFHLSQEGTNTYKQQLKAHMDRTSAGDRVVLSAGEIDCRIDEGLLPFLQKNPKIDPQEHIETMVRHALSFFASKCEEYGLEGGVWGVPAPVIQENKGSDADYSQLNHIIQIMNIVLADTCAKKNLAFFDVYPLTASETGFGGGDAHIDLFHLRPWVYDKLFSAFL